MGATTFSSREFKQDAGRAKRAACSGPVFITDRGKPAHVLLSIENYRTLVGKSANIVDMLAFDGPDNIMFEPARLDEPLARPADLDALGVEPIDPWQAG